MIKRNSKPKAPLRSPRDSKNGCPDKILGLGDLVEKAAKPVAHCINRLAVPVQRIAHWMATFGQPGHCRCQSRKDCLNAIVIDLKHPFKIIESALKCLVKK